MEKFLQLVQLKVTPLLCKDTYWYHIVSASSPKEAFDYLIEELSLWNDYKGVDSFIPKKFHLLSSPNNVLLDSEVADYVKSISNKKIRKNYAVCLFLESNRFIFYSPLG